MSHRPPSFSTVRMTMEMDTAPALQEPETSPLNFIYACTICGATFADAHDGHSETVKGLSDGINPKDRLVTKLYLSGCCHVFCSEHLDGGGPPFHPAGQKPKAPCPYCIKETGDTTVRDLYSIRGFNKDEYDPQIPPIWFIAPPMSLDGHTKEMEALRFQYLALVRYCQTTYRTQKPLADALRTTKQDLNTTQSRLEEERSRVVSLQYDNESLQVAARRASEAEALRAEVQRLQHLECEKNQFDADVEAFRLLKIDLRDLEIFRKNKIAILQYMKLLPKVVEQNLKIKERLSALGFAMPVEPIPNFTQLTPDDLNEIGGITEAYAEDDRRFQKTSSSHTAGRSAHTSGFPFASGDRPLKRQRIDSPLPPDMQVDVPSSHEMMPPPSMRPLHKVHSVRRLIPAIRKKFSSNPLSPKGSQKHDKHAQTRTERWQDRTGSRARQDFPSSKYHTQSNETYLAGALPVEDPLHQSHLVPTVEADSNMSRLPSDAPSPVKMNDRKGYSHAMQLPDEPSYLNFMDGWVSNNNFELGLKDPRENTPNRFGAHQAMETTESTPRSSYHTQKTGNRQRWRTGDAFLPQSSHVPSRASINLERPPPLEHSRGFFSRAHYEPQRRVANSNSSRPRQPVGQAQNMVSPFFRHSHYDAITSPRPWITETQTSSHRSTDSPSRITPAAQEREWHNLRSLNELSFFQLPPDGRNEPALQREPRESFQHMTAKSSHALPKSAMPSEYDRHLYPEPPDYNSPACSTPALARHQHAKTSFSGPSFASFNHGFNSRIGSLPLSVPSAAFECQSSRNQAQWSALKRAGVRSSRQANRMFAGTPDR